jgi:predicted DNA-binding transcriptional regulator YafY
MPKDKNPLDRYRRIHEIFTRRRGSEASIKLQDLADQLGISLRMLSKDMDYMRDKGAPFEYVPIARAWRYEQGRDFAIIDDQLLSDDDVLNVRMAIELFNKINNRDKGMGDLPAIFRKIYNASRKWNKAETPQKHIYFDPLPHYQGGKHLRFFLKAIEELQKVEFLYLAFHTEIPKTVLFDPWFLRHYDRRWYVGGFSHDPTENFVRVFPLERIQGTPKIIGFFHDKPANYNAETYWKDIYGITIPRDVEVQEVILEFAPIQGKYFLSTPFYQPFDIVEDAADKLIIRFRLRPNFDLVQKIASLGAQVRVIAPETLREQIQNFHQKALEQYQ